ncbi:SDR family oxidoreductase [Salipiger bermudensis]|uniref:SDR family oxidoreductase n=1 Tax=Salipiger bermudensis TaxID=344736 RepID=UPI00351797A8
MGLLTGKIAVVTGAASPRGLGKATAKLFAEHGATVVITDLDEAQAQAAADDLPGEGHMGMACNVTDKEACFATAAAVIEKLGAVDILVNNAGIQFRKPMLELETADWRRVLDINLTAAFVVGREAAKRMAKRGRGKVINIGSLTSELARATVAPYTVAKGGIKMLTKAMAAEWGELGIQSNAIGPGYMVTDMNEALLSNPDFDAWVKGRTPMRRWGLPEELAGTCIYLASDASNYVSGQIIYADGGMISVL